MEAPSSAALSDEHWAEHAAQTLGRQRSRFEEFLAAQRARLAEARAGLAAQLEAIGQQLVRDRRETAAARESLECWSQESARQREDLARLRDEMDARQAGWEQALQEAARRQEAFVRQIEAQSQALEGRSERLARESEELAARRAQVEAGEAALAQARQAMALAAQEHRAEVEHVEALRKRLEERLAGLDARAEQLAACEVHTLGQRQRIAREFKAQRAAHRKDLDRRRAELEGLARGDAGQLHALEAQVQSVQQERDRLREELDGARRRDAELSGELTGLRSERDALRDRLAEAERRPSSPPGDPEADGRLDEFRRRYELAMEDLRQLKAQNEALKKQLEGKSPASPPAAGQLDWEAQKRRILETLEAESDEEAGPDRRHERVKIHDVVRSTQEALAAKDRELAEMRQLLENQSANLGAVAVGAAALGQVLDQDEIIREQRESLRRLEEEWKEKLRKAEVDISIERAKIARERAELEEKARQIQESAVNGPAPAKADSGKPARGRWLSRLGLGEGGEA